MTSVCVSAHGITACCCTQAWNLASPVAEPYREFADRWGNADFSKYVDILEQQADEAMQDADQVKIHAIPFRAFTGLCRCVHNQRCLRSVTTKPLH